MSRRLTLCLLCTFYAGSAWAEQAPVKAQFQFSLFDATKTQETLKTPVQDTDKNIIAWKSSALVDSLLALTYDRINLYLYPFQDSSAFISLGYTVREDLELGVDLGYNREILKQNSLTSDSKDTLFGVYAIHFWQFPQFVGETNLIYDRIQSIAPIETPDDDIVKADGYFAKISFTAAIPLRANSTFLCGISYSRARQQADAREQTITRTSLQLAGIRFTL